MSPICEICDYITEKKFPVLLTMCLPAVKAHSLDVAMPIVKEQRHPRPKCLSSFISVTTVSQETPNSDHREQLSVGGKRVVMRDLPISSFADNLHFKVINTTGSRYGVGGTH